MLCVCRRGVCVVLCVDDMRRIFYLLSCCRSMGRKGKNKKKSHRKKVSNTPTHGEQPEQHQQLEQKEQSPGEGETATGRQCLCVCDVVICMLSISLVQLPLFLVYPSYSNYLPSLTQALLQSFVFFPCS